MTAKRKAPPTYVVQCDVALGAFAQEMVIRLDLPDGRSISAIVDERDVRVKRKPQPGEVLRGEVAVTLLGESKDGILVELPRETFTGGPRVVVPKNVVKAAA